MFHKMEFDVYKKIVEGKETEATLAGGNPDEISKLGGEMAVYYARMSGELAEIKDAILKDFLRLTAITEIGGKPISATRAEKESESAVNATREVSRRQVEYLMKAMDKISFACSARVRSFNKEGSF